ncbi:bifunctional 4-hydroxy-2-oxoglutarate aldolase/2-dehydro-3-deoxy-phosphogluconate aldolase [Endozoicomonas sp. SESOKO3]|uniref:bifunctional 4-hydroxy-2-oxoglutarate aldolase/2-dehydro-3-deoxy-phosphogluconate aldolase n=1 Tax=Endozoicomonas sp. SESOKO3 TaxID=2828744 RepID=UPI002147F89D|nr:bifunctional 4-hydroxy-2-oxoglutarate aldolase/2-dehydro-3-deoxy-phosphogluconate aldolase [Endozoicomonas sp. SESOKO3]
MAILFFEVTLRTECAFDAIRKIKEDFPSVKVGAGTILSQQQAEQAASAGADFGVAPGFNLTVVKKSETLNLPFIPGVATPSEIETAHEKGYKLLKLFPAKVLGGVDYLKALSGPYKDVKFMPTGGITQETAQDYLDLPNVNCIGGTWMNK